MIMNILKLDLVFWGEFSLNYSIWSYYMSMNYHCHILKSLRKKFYPKNLLLTPKRRLCVKHKLTYGQLCNGQLRFITIFNLINKKKKSPKGCQLVTRHIFVLCGPSNHKQQYNIVLNTMPGPPKKWHYSTGLFPPPRFTHIPSLY